MRPETESWFSAWAIRCSSCQRSAVVDESPGELRRQVLAVGGRAAVAAEHDLATGAQRVGDAIGAALHVARQAIELSEQRPVLGQVIAKG